MDKRTSKVATLMSDLTTGFLALLTENRKGEPLAQRRRELTATLNGLLLIVQDWHEPPSPN